MPGISVEVVSYLRTNLRDRYKDSYSILKELVQNADDAGASELHVTTYDAMGAYFRHPLLKGPLVCVVNNAKFTLSDACAIHQAGIGTKGLDEDKIGKFGLGLKSVFHLCEALFYVSSPLSENPVAATSQLDKYSRNGLLNPWFDQRYKHWEKVEEHDVKNLKLLVEAQLKHLPGGLPEHWFAIFLPLRLPEHCIDLSQGDVNQLTPQDRLVEAQKWALEPKFPTLPGASEQDRLDASQHIERIYGVLPLLTNLRLIRFCNANAETWKAPEVKATIDFRCESDRLNWRRMSKGVHREHGTIVVEQNRLAPREAVYAVAHHLADLHELNDIVNSDSKPWPWMDALDETQGWQRKPAVAKQHGAVAILDTEGEGVVNISRAVFLPLAESNVRGFHSETICGGKRNFRLALHGYCFVDAGRLGIDEANDGEERSARQDWNRTLIDKVVLPLVIPALEEYRDKIDPLPDRDERIQHLTAGLSCAFSDEYAKCVCSSESWVYLLHGKNAQWEIRSHETALIALPGSQHDLANWLRIFPALSKLSKDHTFVLHDMPSLSIGARYEWPIDVAKQLLSSTPVDAITRDPDLFRALLRFCEHLKRVLGNAIETAICELSKRILSDEKAPLSRLRSNEQNRATFAGLLNLVGESRKLWVPFRDDLVGESENLVRRLQSVARQRIVIPSVLDSVKRSRDLTNEEAFGILSELVIAEPKGGNEDGYRKLMSEAVDWMLDAWPQAVQQILVEPVCELPLFYVRDYSSQRTVRISSLELYAAAEENRLFGRSAQLCERLQACVLEQSILYVDSPSACFTTALGSALPPCTPEHCIEFLRNRPKLIGTLEPRINLLEQLTSAGPDADWASIRYLLHGRTKGIADDLSLIAIDHSPWGRLAMHILDACSQGWRALDESLLDNLTSAEKRKLGIEVCLPSNVSHMVSKADVTKLQLSSLGRDRSACDTIIRNWPSEQENLLRRIPIFLKSDGSLTAITQHTFINTGNVAPPSNIFADLQLIEDPGGIVASRQLAPTLNTEDILRKLLEQPGCHNHWLYIMDQIDTAAGSGLRILLAQVPWLTTTTGVAVSAKQIIVDDSLVDHIAKIGATRSTLVHQTELLSELRGHRNWGRVQVELCPSKAALCKTIGECLKDLPSYRVGVGTWQDGLLEHLLELFTDSEELPAVGLIQTLRELPGIGLPQLEQSLLPEIGKRIDINRSAHVLKHIQARYEIATSGQKKSYLRIFNAFLDEALTQNGFAERLDEISLLNKIGEWRQASRLAIEGHNIAPTSLVNETQLEILKKHRLRASDTAEPQARDSMLSGDGFDESQIGVGVRALEEYLKQWRTDEIPGDAVASLIAMLGAKDGLKEMYDRFKDGRDWQATRNLLLGQQSSQLRFDSYRFWVSEAEPRKVDAINIRGNRFQADVAAEITSLFDGFGDGRFIQYIPLPRNEKCFHIRLRKIDVESLSQSQRLEVLRNTIIAVRNGIYQISGGEIDEEWEKITNVNQLDIDIAQQLILDSSAMLLETQLAGNLPGVLKEIFRDLHSVRQREKVSEQGEYSQAELESIRKEKRTVFARLRESLCKNKDVKPHLIQMIRLRLESQSYDQSSIPFELFQNADDAVVELASLSSSPEELERMRPASLRDQFLIEFESIGNTALLRFLHWGRGINQYRGISRENQDFSRDMERMLVLQGSGKHGEGIKQRTGGFGLGFKSVLFVCDEPVVFSGARSRFRVLAGVFPESLSNGSDKKDEERLKKCLEELGDHNHKGTVVELRLQPGVDADALLSKFRDCAGYLVVFSRAIHKCDVVGLDSKPSSFAWHPQNVLENICVGELNGAKGKHRALVVTSADSSDSVLVPLDKVGVNPSLTAAAPEIWVTTPTGHEGRSGILVNGAFDVNPGRTQLRDTKQNADRARSIGISFGDALCRLFEFASNDWISCRHALGCPDITPNQFWSSLWSAATKAINSNTTDPAKRVVQTVLFGTENCGVLKLIRSHPTLPTGLHGDYEALAKLKDCRWRLDGILARDAIWDGISQLEGVRTYFVPGTVLSEKTSRELQGISQELYRALNPLTLGTILGKLLDKRTAVPPELANELSCLVNKALWEEMEGIESLRPELEELRDTLSQLTFQNKNGVLSPCRELLIEREHEQIRQDELKRAAFAPPANLLSENYSDDAIDFFAVCRGEIHAPASTLASWLAGASSPAEQAAGMAYLCTGELCTSLQNAIRGDAKILQGTWLKDQSRVEAASEHLESHYRGFISYLLGFTQYVPTIDRPSVGKIADIKKTFNAIYDWWTENRLEILRTHDNAIYASGGPPKLIFSSSEFAADLEAKKEWLKLFFRGAMFRIGRLTPHQAKQFLREFEDCGWLAQMADNDTPSEWFRILDEYLEQESQRSIYYHYMNQFLAYYQLARWLPKYVRAFEAVTRPGVNLNNLQHIREITDLHTSHIFEGASGFDAPPCYVTMGKGSHFVLREVIRSRIKSAIADQKSYKVNTRLAQQAFVPSLAVLQLLEDITGDDSWTKDSNSREAYAAQSKRIYQLLEEHLGQDRATFDGNYDIPLLALTWNNFAEDCEDILGFNSESNSDPEELDFLTESDEDDE